MVANPPRSPDFDPPLAHAAEYGVGGSVAGDGFFWDHFNRKTIVYYTSNFGMLQGFEGETGKEVVAFIPDDIVGLALTEVPGSRDTLKDIVKNIVTTASSGGVLGPRVSTFPRTGVEKVSPSPSISPSMTGSSRLPRFHNKRMELGALGTVVMSIAVMKRPPLPRPNTIIECHLSSSPWSARRNASSMVARPDVVNL